MIIQFTEIPTVTFSELRDGLNAESLSQEITRKQQARPEHITRLARVVARLAEHVKALQQERLREETEGMATDG